MKKKDRQEKINELITTCPISTQDELLQKLKEAGIDATQATISRDIREMGLAKMKNDEGVSVYSSVADIRGQKQLGKLEAVLRESVETITTVQFMNVIKTAPNEANVIGALVDDLNDAGVVGTLAGFDTLVLISPSPAAATDLANRINDCRLGQPFALDH